MFIQHIDVFIQHIDIFSTFRAQPAGHKRCYRTQTVSDDGEATKCRIADAQQRYDALLPKMLKKTKDIKKGRFTLGDEVSSLAPNDDVDALIFVRAIGSGFTKGRTAFSL